jgi:hypothetical protein
VPAPVVQAVEAANAVQDADSRARLSVTTTVPRSPEMLVPGPLVPMLAVAGAVNASRPELTVKVTVVVGELAIGLDEYASTADRAVAADAATGVSAIPATAATARMENADLTILLPF